MDRPGGIPGGVIAEIRNFHSRRLYVVSTSPELGKDYWTISVMPAEEKRSFFGLSTRTAPDFYHPIANFIRNRKEDAHQIHAQVRHIVSNLPEAEWFDSFPSPKPPEGYSPGARAHLESIGVDPDVSTPSPSDVDSGPPRDAQDHAERLCSLVIALAGQTADSFAREKQFSLYLPDAGKVMLRARFQQFGDSMAYANLVATSRNPTEDPNGYFRDLLTRYEAHHIRTCTGDDPNAKSNLARLRLEFIACTEKGIAPVDHLTAVVMSEGFLPSAGAAVRERVKASAEVVRDVVAGSALDPEYFER
jgi:hypothetical protein